MVNEMINWEKFITENRAEIDEFLGINNPIYTAIALKGKISKEFKDFDRSLDYFGALMESGKTQRKQNTFLLSLLLKLRKNKGTPEDHQMRFGLKPTLLLGKDKKEFFELMVGEFPYYKCPVDNKYCESGKICEESING